MRKGSMFSRRLPLVLAAATGLLLAAGAAAAPEDTFTAALTPSHVKASTSTTYTMTLTNTSPSVEANRATIAIPDGFDVAENTVKGSTSASGATSCTCPTSRA
jgi:hypothetical protein